ncbi:MAG: hypothetical protein ACQESC_00975 [Nanobdellota archaeon]
MKLLLICPNCRQKMQYHNRTPEVIGKTKKCVFCGRTFTIKRDTIEGTIE